MWGWRAVFFVGVLPAFFTFWVRRAVKEPELWRRAKRVRAVVLSPTSSAVAAAAHGCGHADECLHPVRVVGLQPVDPRVSSLPAASGGVGLSTAAMSGFIVAMQVGMWFGYVTFGFISDAIGRRRTM